MTLMTSAAGVPSADSSVITSVTDSPTSKLETSVFAVSNVYDQAPLASIVNVP